MGDRLPQTSRADSCSGSRSRAPWCTSRPDLADEPTGNLDPRLPLVMELLQAQTGEQGAALVLVTHSHDGRRPG